MGHLINIKELQDKAFALVADCGLYVSQNKAEEDEGASILEAQGLALNLIIGASKKVKAAAKEEWKEER